MQPFVTADRLRQAYRRYIQTSFPLRRDEVRRRFEALIEREHLLWRDPFVSLSRPFAPGARFADLIAEGVLAPAITTAHWGFDGLFAHQVDAVRRLTTASGRPRNTIVASSTGSGKTEAFTVPIVDDCLRHPGDGVRAVILYPMNALANDQLKRLRTQLAGTGVTFGRYTGDTPLDAQAATERRGMLPRPPEAPAEERYYRREIQDRPPQILITNYTMLELLLLKKREQQILHGVHPKFLVLDEVHTYTGILGTEVACLIRRFKEHAGLATGEIVCVGTSATVRSGGTTGDPGDERRRLVGFASDLFGEEFADDAIVEERFAPLEVPPEATYATPREFPGQILDDFDPDRPETVAALYRAVFGRDLRAEDDDVYVALHGACRRHREFYELERLLVSPRSLADVLDDVRRWPRHEHQDEAALRAEVSALFLLGCAAYPAGADGDAEPRFRPKVHLQVRSLAPLHACLDCGELLTDGRTECRSEAHGGERRGALGLGVCRSCGQDYLLGTFTPAAAGDEPAPRGRRRRPARLAVDHVGAVELLPGDPGQAQRRVLYLFPGRGDQFELGEDAELGVRSIVYGVCSRCLVARPLEEGETDPRCGDPRCSGNGVEVLRPYAGFLGGSRCPVCQGQGRGRRPAIITPLRTGAAAAVSVLTQSLFPELRRGGPGETDEKKVLIFADSRQDTAHQAGYLRDRHQIFTQRQIAFRMLRQRQPIAPWTALCDETGRPTLATELFLHTRAEYTEIEALNLLTPVAARSGEDAGFFDPNRTVTEGDRTRAIDRLHWDLALEFTDRGTSRYSLEREGLCTVRYPGLEAVGEQLVEYAPGTSPALREALLRALLDYLRLNRAVDYPPFRDYLGAGSDAVRRGIARPTRQTRTPFGMDAEKRARRGAYEVKAWYTRDNPGGHRTGIFDIACRSLPHLSVQQVVTLVDQAVAALEGRGYLRLVEIGRLSARGRLTTRAYQLAQRLVEVGVGGERYRCDACGRTMGYTLVPAGATDAICPAYRCRGAVHPHAPDLENNFYARMYARQQPERLFPMEHSGQLSGEERVQIEEKFRSGLVNALVCTPTLELGVDIGDLVALVMRNIPPTPSNYAQRAGRAGRRRRIALVVSHSGQGPHDCYFFEHPEEMIAGAIRPPMFLLDNQVVINRHLTSLILEKLAAALPGEWSAIRTDDGQLREEVLRPFQEELASTLGTVQQAVARAFVRERAAGGLSWLDDAYVRSRIDAFLPAVRAGLDHWCARYREIYRELAHSRRAVVPSAADQQREIKLRQAIEVLESDQRYFPPSYLAQVGVLPRYGFPGETIVVRDYREREISQTAAWGISEFAPGNLVYVAGRKLRVDRILFPAGAREDPRQNAETYRYCPHCDFVTTRALDQTCPFCGETLSTGRYVDYQAARGTDLESIGQEDEYRERESYALATYLCREQDPPAAGGLAVDAAGWPVRYSRLRRVEIYNRGRWNRASGQLEPFVVCLECGLWHEKIESPDEDDRRTFGTGHMPTCTVSAWNPDDDDRIERALHLRAAFQGDVVQFGISGAVASDPSWMETFAEALRLGMRLEMFVGTKDIGSFVRRWQEGGAEQHELVLYDTMPGGTGYLRRLVEDLARIARRAADHLEACRCERACYRCLMEFWNQRAHHLLDKQRVITALRTLAAAGAPASTDPAQDVRFESFLEARFYRLLATSGVPLPATQQLVRSADGRYIIRADFRYAQPSLAILTDGRAFHAHDPFQVIADLDQRNRLEFSGCRLLEFTYDDVVLRPEAVVATVRRGLGLSPGAGAAPADDTGARAPAEDGAATTAAMPAAGAEPPASSPPSSSASSSPVVTIGESGAMSAAEQAFAARLTAADRRLVPGTVVDSAGVPSPALGVDPTTRRLLLAVDPDGWVADPVTWSAALRLHNALRLGGWRVVRIPTPWFESPEGEILLQDLARMG